MASNDPPEPILGKAGPRTVSVADLIELEEIPHHNLFPLGVKVADLPQAEQGAHYVIVALPAGLLRSLLERGLRGLQGPILIAQPPAIGPGSAAAQDDAPIEPLSPRELDVLQLLAHGASNRALARDLIISPATAKKHVSNILRKLGARNRTEAVRRGRSLGLCD